MNKTYTDRLKTKSIVDALGTSREVFDKVADGTMELAKRVAGSGEGEYESTAEMYHELGNLITKHVFNETEERELSEFEMMLIHMAFKTGEVWQKIMMMEKMKGEGGPLAMLSKILGEELGKPDECDGDCDNCNDDHSKD